MGTKSQRPKSGQYVGLNCSCVFSQHCAGSTERYEIGAEEKRGTGAHLPEEEVAQPADAAGAHEEVERGAARARGHQLSGDVVFRDLAGGAGRAALLDVHGHGVGGGGRTYGGVPSAASLESAESMARSMAVAISLRAA